MLESLLRPRTAEKKPWDVFLIAALFSLVGVAFALQLFPSQSSVFSVSLITIMFMPFFQRFFEIEEKKDYKLHKNLLMRHRKLFYIFGIFFIGVIVALSFVYVFFPSAKPAFALQENWYSSVSGQATSGGDYFWQFFYNNSQVLIMMFILSAIFGAGAVFILAWNASVIAVYIGNVVSSMGGGTAYLVGLPLGLASIALHGIPEIGAYFVGGLAGGMLSVGIMRERFHGHFEKIFVDSLIFLALAEALIFVAALLEAFV